MARLPRIHFPGALYHVISRGNQRQAIFQDRDDYEQFEGLLEEAQNRFEFALYAYVLMPNHLHLLLQVDQLPLSKVMQTLLYRYTRYYNRRHRKVGHLFQGRYKAILCDRESYLLELIRYLHLNPVRAHIVRDPKSYRWSSHRIYLEGKAQRGVAVEEVLKHWSSRRRQAIEGYEQFVLEGIGQGHREEYYEVKEQRYLGEEEFVEQVERQLDKGDGYGPVKVSMSEIVDRVGRQWGRGVSEICGKGRGRQESMLRAIAAYVGREVGELSLTETAKYLKRDLATLSLGIRRLEEKIRKDTVLREQVDNFCGMLREEGGK